MITMWNQKSHASTSTPRGFKIIPVIPASMRGLHLCRFSDRGTSCCIQKQEEVLPNERQDVIVISASMRSSHLCRLSDDGTSCCIQNKEEIPLNDSRTVPVISVSVSSLQPSSDTPVTQHPRNTSDPVVFHPACSQSRQFEKLSKSENSLADADALSMNRSGIKKVQNTSTVKSYQMTSMKIKCIYCMKRFDHGSNLLKHLNSKCRVIRELCGTNKISSTCGTSSTSKAPNTSRASSKSRASSTNGTSGTSGASRKSRASTTNNCRRYVQNKPGIKALVTTPHIQRLSESRNSLKAFKPSKYLEQYKQTCITHESKRIVKNKVKNEEKNCPKKWNKVRTLNCPSCQRSFNSYYDRIKHIWLKRCPVLHKLNSKGKRLDCCRNARKYQNPFALTQHVAEEHTCENDSKPLDKEPRGILCSGCGKEFKLMKYLRQHHAFNRCKREHLLD